MFIRFGMIHERDRLKKPVTLADTDYQVRCHQSKVTYCEALAAAVAENKSSSTSS